MIKEEGVVKECIKNDHKGCQILAVDLSEEFNKENDQKKYYCVKCLIEKIGTKKIILYEEAKNKGKFVNEELKKNTVQKHQQTKESFQKLSEVIKLIQGEYQTKFEDLKKQLDAQINNEQKKLQSVQESAITDDIKLLSSCYQEDGKIASPSPNIDYKEITEFLIEIKKIIYQF
ncbi:unnamed protein product (macronuclear) [Paramecium tetraurelia]|uniref:Uncharacterized protein n=1 Tax=Paramecium tetraurelia TaxID=5888 RepID=A0BKB2_PARTE|nr:uncharacterized protein GSPATT00029610001 [Paramecium tetraurelia]CAK58979.1 unnamed protein product [Paramecium tetraurelia]|eukprot:XP_001426377.1 hypothetical protein (macronuclear) [Paramecium tetraurelia strain d4-2]